MLFHFELNFKIISDMKRLLLLEIIGLLSILSAYPLSRDYYLKQAESY